MFSALSDWITERDMLTLVDQNALFVTLQNRRRISRAAVHKLVKKHLAAAGLDSTHTPPTSCAIPRQP